MNRLLRNVAVLAPLIALETLVVGCSRESNNPDVKIAEQAIGAQPEQTAKEGSKVTRNLTVEHDTIVRDDDENGRVLSEKVERTPVKITKETKVETDVKVGEQKPAK